MKKNYLKWIIIFSTVISITTMNSYSDYISNRNQYEKNEIFKQTVADSNNNLIPSKNNHKYIEGNVVKNDDIETSYVKDNLKEDDLPQKKVNSEGENSTAILDTSSSNVDIEGNEMDQYIYNGKYLSEEWYSLENNNYDNKNNELSVFKVSTGKIIENLTSSDKIKLLYVSIKLGKEDYKKVKNYLYSRDAEDGVLKALKLLKENLSEKEYKKVRIIAGRFIDMEAAERLY
ncbi:hypothetical protein [Clostridium sp.]|uniref:hypothetical protein n=1 Tax=Clostridium sp. TaxID=1506 RepID=UPI001A5338A9|nr:hypothetical protein [Clostridium sp.]MBK5240177.1 hypothetical protein [Clostridium sp.]